MNSIIKKIKSCRVCKKNNFTKIFTFGPTPLANAFLDSKRIDSGELFYPLDVYFCNECSFVELGHVVSPEVLFGNYIYVSSTSPVFIKHFENFASSVSERFNLNTDSMVIDVGSNDGILLEPFKKRGIRVLGVEPAKKIASVAKKKGIETKCDFFDTKLANKILKEKGSVDIITATNVFAHIDDLDEIIRGLKILLKKNGVFIIEAPYLVDFITKKYFDLVYHEHLSYWSINSLIRIFKRFDMKIFDVEKVQVHGGSVRVFISKNASTHKTSNNVSKFLHKEKEMELSNPNTYLEYNKKILKNKVDLLSLLVTLKNNNKKIAAYGAPAKGNTLLNYFGIGSDLIEYIIDDSSWKQGTYSPGKRIPVVDKSFVDVEKVDYILILAWNFADDIIEKNILLRKKGIKFIIPAPKPKIVI